MIKTFIKAKYPYLLWLLLLLYLMRCAYKGGDFDVYLFEATKLRNGMNVYIAPTFEGMPYTYSVLWALILIPFSYLPNFIPEFLWLVLSCYFLYRSINILTDWLDLGVFAPKAKNWLLILCAACTIRFLLYNFSMIQMTLFLMYASLEGVNLIQKNKKFAGSLLLALAMNIKIVPLVFLPYLIYRKEFRASAYIVVLLITMLFVPGLFIGFAFNWQMLSDWWVAVNPSSDSRMLGETGIGPVGLPSLIPVMLMDNIGELALKRNFVNLPVETVKMILNGVRLILIIFTLYFLRFPPFKKFISSKHTVWEMAYLFCIIPLLAPQQQKYAFFFVFPAVLYILYFLFYQYQQKLVILGKYKFRLIIVLFSLFVTLTTLTSDGLVGRKLNRIFQHYRTITYGGMVLAVTLSLCRPEFLQKENERRDLL